MGLTPFLYVVSVPARATEKSVSIPQACKLVTMKVEMGILNFMAVHAYMMSYGITLFVLIFSALGMGAISFSASVLESPLDSSRRGFTMAGRGHAVALNAA
jgi:hypothetical protein